MMESVCDVSLDWGVGLSFIHQRWVEMGRWYGTLRCSFPSVPASRRPSGLMWPIWAGYGAPFDAGVPLSASDFGKKQA